MNLKALLACFLLAIVLDVLLVKEPALKIISFAAMSKDNGDLGKKSKRDIRREREARLAKFDAEQGEDVQRVVATNTAFVPQNATIGPGLNNIYAKPVKPRVITKVKDDE